MSTQVVDWTKSFLTNWQITLALLGQAKHPNSFKSSFLLGSLVSPTLFYIYGQVMLEEVDHTVQDGTASYIDDDIISSSIYERQDNIDNINTKVQTRIERGHQIGLHYDHSKTGLLRLEDLSGKVIHRLRKPVQATYCNQDRQDIKLENTIKLENMIKQLDIMIDNRLSFLDHV